MRRWRCPTGGNQCYLAYLGCVDTPTILAVLVCQHTCHWGSKTTSCTSTQEDAILRQRASSAGCDSKASCLSSAKGCTTSVGPTACESDPGEWAKWSGWWMPRGMAQWKEGAVMTVLLQARVSLDNCFCMCCCKPVQEVHYTKRGLVFTDGKWIRERDIAGYRASLGFDSWLNVMVDPSCFFAPHSHLLSICHHSSWSCCWIAIWCCFNHCKAPKHQSLPS